MSFRSSGRSGFPPPRGAGILLVLLLGLTACRGPEPAATGEPSPTAVTMLEQQLLEVIELEKRLDAAAAVEDADYREVQRQFETVAQLYRGIIARNPDSLEARLLFGKLLSRYGDREGARDQFLMAAKIDPAVAVIHQQLSNYYAEEEDFTRALAYALNAVRLQPDVAAYHFGLGQVLAAFKPRFIEEGVFTADQVDQQMLDAFRTAMELEPDSIELKFRYGEAFYDTASTDWELALAHWKALEENPDLSPTQLDAVFLHQARCLAELGQLEEARRTALRVSTPEFRGSAEALFGK